MFDSIKRVIPEPQKPFEKQLKPMITIFDEIQKQIDPLNKELPDCKKFVSELFNTNMLLRDVYVPTKQLPRVRSTLPNCRADAILGQLDENPDENVRNLLTNAVKEMCSAFLEHLFAAEIPFTVRSMIKIVYDAAKSKGTEVTNDEKVRQAAYLIADLLAGCWLSNGFRWAECLGATPALKEEAYLQGVIL